MSWQAIGIFDSGVGGLTVLRDLGFVPEAEIQGRQSGGGVAQRAPLDHLSRQIQPVGTGGGDGRERCGAEIHVQALGSCCVLRASSFSTRFIMMDGAVSALLFCTVR